MDFFLPFKKFPPLRGDFPLRKCFPNFHARWLYTTMIRLYQSERAQRENFGFSTLLFEICYYFQHSFGSQNSPNACTSTLIQLGEKTHPILGKILLFFWENINYEFFLGAPRIYGKIHINIWNKKHCNTGCLSKGFSGIMVTRVNFMCFRCDN